jgi:CheY-like chemotaxis protein
MSDVLREIGYLVHTAKNGYSALREIRRKIPDVLLSDLHMPGMSGFELFSVVRRRFPSILVIAMSGAFAGDEVPSGVPADGFFQKGSSTGALLQILTAPSRMKRRDPRLSSAAPPVPIQRIASVPSSDGWFTIACPDCRKTATKALHGVGSLMCVYCSNSIEYAIVEPSGQSQSSQHWAGAANHVQNTLTFGG